MKIRLDLGIQQDRGPSVHEIEDFDDMLLFTRRISRNAGDIFEVYLDFFKWLTPFQWLAFPASLLSDAFFHLWIGLRIRRFAPQGFSKQHTAISWRSFTQAFSPFLDPSDRSTNPVRQFLLGPLRMQLHEPLEHRSISNPVFLLHHTLLSRKFLSRQKCTVEKLQGSLAGLRFAETEGS